MRITLIEIAIGAVIIGVLIMAVSVFTGCAAYKAPSDYPQGPVYYAPAAPSPVPERESSYRAAPFPFKTITDLRCSKRCPEPTPEKD